MVYDVTRRATFESVDHYVQGVRQHAGDDLVIVLVGYKCDVQENRRAVSASEGSQLVDQLGLLLIETSALDATNVNKAFHTLISTVRVPNKRAERIPFFIQLIPTYDPI